MVGYLWAERGCNAILGPFLWGLEFDPSPLYLDFEIPPVG